MKRSGGVEARAFLGLAAMVLQRASAVDALFLILQAAIIVGIVTILEHDMATPLPGGRQVSTSPSNHQVTRPYGEPDQGPHR